MNRFRLAAAAALALGLAAAGPAPKDASLGPQPTRLTGYLSVSDLDGKAIIGPPPAAGSPEDRADHAIFEATRALEGTPRWKIAIQDNDLWGGGAVKRFACAIGRDISPTSAPITYRLLQRLELDVRTVGTPPKDFYDRKRPLIGNDAPLCVPREDWMKTNASYPSGHSMTAWSWALVLSEMDPAQAGPLLVVGREEGQSRVVCGVHFQSDVDAGRVLGAAMVARLHADPAFMADLAKAKRELAAVRARPADCPAG